MPEMKAKSAFFGIVFSSHLRQIDEMIHFLNAQMVRIVALRLGLFSPCLLFCDSVSDTKTKVYSTDAHPTDNGNSLRVGSTSVEITPPPGWRMSGYFYERLNAGTADPLFAKILYFQQGETIGAIAHCDLIGITQRASNLIRLRVSKETGIPFEHCWVAATHSHTGPLYGTVLRDFFHEQAVEKHGKDPYEPIDYVEFLSDQITSGVKEAIQNSQWVSVNSASPKIQDIAFNRRFLLSDGTIKFNPGKLNPKIVRPLGPTDPSVDFLLFKNADKKPIASLTTFAMHLDTVGGREYSADYPVYISSKLREALGEGLVSVFGTGTCGDINHIDVRHNLPQKGQEEARRIGESLAGAVLNDLKNLQVLGCPSLKFGSEKFFAQFHEYSRTAKKEAQSKLALIGSPELSFMEGVEVYRIADIAHRGGDGMELEVQAIQLAADTVIVGLPGEVFVDLGLAIKKESPYAKTIVIELVNACPGYIPTRKAFSEGSYETVNTRFQSGVGEAMVDAVLALLSRMKLDIQDE